MYRVYFSSVIFWFGFTIEASHFRGGTITWKPINNNITAGSIVYIMITQTYSWTLSQIGCNSSMIATQSPTIDLGIKAGSGADLMCNASCSTSGGYVGHEVPITGYCTDFSNAISLTVSQRSDIVNLTFGAHFAATFGAGGGWQTLALGNSSGWSLSSVIDLRVRSDNGLINTPPVATCISYISVPVNITQTIPIPVLDADNDFLRCRFANGSAECVNTCPPGSLPSGTSLSSSCILTITGITAGDYYLVAIQIEDFITNTSTTALSSVPLQFLIYVYAVPSCTLKPLLISDFNSDACQGAQVGVNFTMTLTVINRCGSGRTISDIATLSFPIVIKTALVQNATNTSLWSMEITWMPTISQVGSQVFCAVAVDSADVQSDQYCITFFVGFSSVPLCPGATAAPTTTTTTITTITTSVIISSTTSTTTRSSLSVATSTMLSSLSLSLSTTAKPENTINWPLILGLCLAALALALCCLLCCWYHLRGPGASRRRRKKNKAIEDSFEWRQQSGNPYQNFSKRRCQKHPNEREQDIRIIGNSDSWISNSVTITKISQRGKSLIDDRGNVTLAQSSEKTVDRSNQFKRRVSFQKIDIRDKTPQTLTLDKMPHEIITQMLSTLQDGDDLLITPLCASTIVHPKSVNVIKIPRIRKSSSFESHQSRSTLSVKIQPTKNPHRNLSDLGSTKKNQRRVSNVSVTRIKRSSSAGRISPTNQRTTTASSNINLSRVTVIKMT